MHHTLSDFSIKHLRPNFREFYAKVFENVRKKIHNFPDARYPRKVDRFEDKLVRIKTNNTKSFLIRLPYKAMNRIMTSFWRDYNAFAEFLYTYVPLLSSYTLKQK